MNWHKKTIIKKVFALLVSILMTIVFAVLFVSAIKEEPDGLFIFALLLLLMCVVTYSQYKQLIEAIEKQKEASNTDLISALKYVNPYGSPAELAFAFEAQKANALYRDEKVTITDTFIQRTDDNKIFMVDGVLDVVSYVQKANGIIEYVSLIFLYYDGNRYEIKYRRPLGVSDMQKKAAEINYAANIIAKNSKHFRKYPAYRL